MKKAGLILFALAAFLLFAEFASYLVVRSGLLPAAPPDYEFKLRPDPFWADIDSHFGVWHVPATFRHKRECFEVHYRMNSVGARDKERQTTSTGPRVIVLGDSFVEGYGVEEDDRFSTLLESQSGIEFLNFGTAGTFGPTQYFLLYKHLAKKFDHTVVLVGLLPHNDFFDDDLEISKVIYHDRYRPYWTGQYPDYHLTYYLDSLGAGAGSLAYFKKRNRGWRVYVAEVFRSYSWLYNTIEYSKKLLTYQTAVKSVIKPNSDGNPAYSGYFDFTQDQFDRMRYSLEKIKTEAGGKRVIVLSIPSRSDFKRSKGTEPPFSEKMRQLADSTGFEFIDLLEPMSNNGSDPDSYFLTCDDHWSPEGHAAAAAILKKYFEERPL